jgi:hypothetical protein
MDELAWSAFQTMWSFGFGDIEDTPYLLRLFDQQKISLSDLWLLCSPGQLAAITSATVRVIYNPFL